MQNPTVFKSKTFLLPESKLTEQEQAALAVQGTEAALTELAMDNIQAGFAYGRCYCGNRFQDDELLSAVYKALMAAARRFRPGRCRLSVFAKPFIRGELHRAWKQKICIGVPLPIYPANDHNYAPTSDDEDPGFKELECEFFDYDAVDREVVVNRIQPWLSRLTKHERLIVDLVYYGGYSQTDAATLIGVKRQALQQILRRIHGKFRKWLK